MTSIASIDPSSVTASWPRWLLWGGVPACLFGLWQSRLWMQWEAQRSRELVALALMACAAAWVIRRLTTWSLASGLAIVWCLALLVFTGVLPVIATALLAVAAIAMGGCLAPRESPLLKCACGLMLVGGLLGWLLPLPIHFRWTYLPALLLLAYWRRRSLMTDWRVTQREWRKIVGEHPRLAALAVLALGLALTGCWLPTLQADDTAYHLRLPWQLLEYGSYPLDPTYNVWALAPWAADILQAIPQMIAGEEARGSLNALWIAITAAGVWHLALSLGGSRRAAWMAVALYASFPLTASLAGTMQTETPTAALLVWLMALIARDPDAGEHRAVAVATLVGGLLALKLGAAVLALLVLPWALWRARTRLGFRKVCGSVVIAAFIGGSSYAYAGIVARNPFLPLFNAWFRSPYFGPSNFDDPRWHAGFNVALPWHMTFDTERYMEIYGGGIGFMIVLLAGAWLLAVLHRPTRGAALTCSALVWLPLLPTQYVRYVFPALVALVPILAVTACRVHPRRAGALLAAVCALNFAFQANGSWLLRTGAIRQVVRSLGNDQQMYENYAPERLIISDVRADGGPKGSVIYLDPDRSYIAELGDRARVVNWYSPALEAAAQSAQGDASGARWAALLRQQGVSDVMLSEQLLVPAQRNALRKLQARRRELVGGIEWWSLPTVGAPR